MFGSFMISETSKFLAAITELAALQFRFGVIWAEFLAGSLMSEAPLESPQISSKPSAVDAAARAIKLRIFENGDSGFRKMLQVNFPDDEIRAMAKAALLAAKEE
jgi:hypothetical protein